jgi:Na+-driven multidrug efflux pump
MPLAMEYLSIVGAGFFFFGLSMCASNLIRSEGNTKASMKGMLLGAGLNTILDPIFIFGFGMGVRGAAIATVINQVASVLYLASLYTRKKMIVPLVASEFRIRPKILVQSFLDRLQGKVGEDGCNRHGAGTGWIYMGHDD